MGVEGRVASVKQQEVTGSGDLHVTVAVEGVADNGD